MTDTEPSRLTFKVVPGTDIEAIRSAHPEWSEDQCRDHQTEVAKEAFLKLLGDR